MLTISVLFAATLSSVRILYVSCSKEKYIEELMHGYKQAHNFPAQCLDGGSLCREDFCKQLEVSLGYITFNDFFKESLYDLLQFILSFILG